MMSDDLVPSIEDELKILQERFAAIAPTSTFTTEPNLNKPNDSDDYDELTDHEYEDDHSVYENKAGLADDIKFLASMPELCDVTFLVGETREPVCAVKAVLAARSR